MTSARDQRENEELRGRVLNAFAGLDYDILDAAGEQGGDYTPTGRAHDSEVVLVSRLRAALLRLNTHIPYEVRARAIDAAIARLLSEPELLPPAEANRAVYRLLKDGVPVKLSSPAGSFPGEEYQETVRVIAWSTITNNDFLLVSNFWVSGREGRGRLDFVGFVNGLPFLLPIARAPGRREQPLQHLYETEISDHKRRFPQLFWYNAFILLSDGRHSKLGSLTAPWEHFSEWKRVESEEERGDTSLETMLLGTCEHSRLLDIVENFTLFRERAGGLDKIIARNHQYLGVNAAFARMRHHTELAGKLGVFWHTQGAGKSYSMIFFEEKVQRKLPGNWRFLVITDRIDLDQQIYENFASVGAVTEPEETARVSEIQDLLPRLHENHKVLFMLLHKFRDRPTPEQIASIPNGDALIVMTDEAHRSEYADLATHMHTLLPHALYLGFTGTPLIGEEIHRTRAVFGPYVSKYTFIQAIKEGVTVPLIYTNRTPELSLNVAAVARRLREHEENARLDEKERQKLRSEVFQEKELIKAGPHLDFVARDIVEHLVNRGYRGKAMIVCLDKLTTVRMYNRVRATWPEYQVHLEQLLASEQDEEQRAELAEKLAYMRSMNLDTDLAVVVSSGEQSDDDAFARFNRENPQEQVDIRPHYERFSREKLDEKFKDAADSLRIVFVCAMWMTGFDVPALSTLYLDHPMKLHTLMQALARPNRLFRSEKKYGEIVDYVGIYQDLLDALSIYAQPEDELPASSLELPFSQKEELRDQLEQALSELEAFCAQHGVDVPHLLAIQAATSSKIQRDAVVQEMANALLLSEDVKLNYLSRAWFVHHLYRALQPDSEASRFSAHIRLYRQVTQAIFEAMNCVDVSEVLELARGILAEEMAVNAYETRWSRDNPDRPIGEFDLSKINFDELERRTRSGNAYLQAERLRSVLQQRLQQMIRTNPTRIDFLNRLEELVDTHNETSANNADYPAALIELARDVRLEEQRALREQLSEEELALADLLIAEHEPAAGDWEQVKTIARNVLANLRGSGRMVDNWYNKQDMNAGILTIIRNTLQNLPGSYSAAQYRQKVEEVYRHVRLHYEDYGGDGPISA